jgi:hypothetical protein
VTAIDVTDGDCIFQEMPNVAVALAAQSYKTDADEFGWVLARRRQCAI